MNLYLRLLLMLLTVKLKSKISVLDDYVTSHTVWPVDMDLFGHMNNGRYFTITDIVRMEMIVRSGLAPVMRKRRLYPVMAGETIQFRAPLNPFRRYQIRTRTLGWDDKFFYMEHRFQRKGKTHAVGVVKIRIVGKSRPSPAELLREVVADVADNQTDPVIEQWNASSDAQWNGLQL